MNKFDQNTIGKKDIEIDSKKCKSIANKVKTSTNKDNVIENNSVIINSNNNENILFERIPRR